MGGVPSVHPVQQAAGDDLGLNLAGTLEVSASNKRDDTESFYRIAQLFAEERRWSVPVFF